MIGNRLCIEEERGFTLRKADENDVGFLYELRNEEEVRKNSFQTEWIPYEQHTEWFDRKLLNPNTKIFILEFEGKRIGQVRAERSGRTIEISYALCKEFRGNGYSKWMLTELEKRIRKEYIDAELFAEVKTENIASRKIFQSLGYREEETGSGYRYKKELPLFSILMCTYNSGDTLEHSIDSVLNQEFQSWELIILDNGSRDRTLGMLEDYQKKDSRIHCVFRENNVGWCKGISICLEYALGKYMMFLGADDYLAGAMTLQEVAAEAEKHAPDIIWTSNGYAVLEEGEYKVTTCTVPQYYVYEKEDKLTELVGIMNHVYYNSVMHYVKIDFLKAQGIDFFFPFYGDGQGMTEALCKAGKMVVMDKMEYVLTVNTSKTAGGTIYDYDVERQWRSVREALPELETMPKADIAYVAERILNNLTAMYENMVTGGEMRDKCMNRIEVSLSERFCRAEEWLSSDGFAEMMNYAGREKFEEHLIGAAGVLYWTCKKAKALAAQICEKSRWLADFVEAALEMDEKGQVVWKKRVDQDNLRLLMNALESPANPHRIGSKILMREGIIHE